MLRFSASVARLYLPVGTSDTLPRSMSLAVPFQPFRLRVKGRLHLQVRVRPGDVALRPRVDALIKCNTRNERSGGAASQSEYVTCVYDVFQF